MEKEAIPSFKWDEQTEETKAPKMDDFATNVASIREALKKRPTSKGYLTLIGELLDRELLDDAKKVTEEFNKWKESEKKSKG
jgi:hypothetical protein